MTLRQLIKNAHTNAHNKGFYKTRNCLKSIGCIPLSGNTTAQIMLVVTELSEAVEALRHDDIPNFQEEIADTFIRLFDMCGALGMENLEEIILRKMEINANREEKHGKEF